MVFAAHESPETVLCIGNKLDLANQLVTKIRDFLTQVPRWYWGDEYYSPDPKSEKNLKDIFDTLKEDYFKDKDSFSEISMGMSDDYPIAIEEGATMVRVGSKIFGARNYNV